MSLAPLRVAAAAYVLDAISSEDLRRVADEALSRGVYSYSLGELGTTASSIYSEVRPLFRAALKELAIPCPAPKEAAYSLIWYYLGQVIEGHVTPLKAITALRKLTVSLSIKSTVWPLFSAAEQERLRLFEGCYWSYDEVRELSGAGGSMSPGAAAEAVEGLDREVRNMAAEWMSDRFRWRIDAAWLRWNDGIISKVAQVIGDTRSFSNLPLLAGALEEAGCLDVELLEHCREPGPHVSECWVVQLLLLSG